MLTSIRNVKFIYNVQVYNVYHHCLCVIFDQNRKERRVWSSASEKQGI